MSKSLTAAEFKAIPRYSNGRVIDLPEFYFRMTDAQRQRLHSDDWSYGQDLEEEVRVLAADFVKHEMEVRS